MKPVAMLLLAVALTAAAWWWFTSEMPRRERERARARVAEVAMAQVEQASSLYRWRDANGVLHISDDPPRGRKYQRIGREARDGIEISGSQQ